MSIACKVCGTEYYSAKEAFDCETKCREEQDPTERDGVTYAISVVKTGVADFRIRVVVHYELEEPIQPKVIALPCYVDFINKIKSSDRVDSVYIKGVLRTYQLEDGLEALKNSWRDVIKNRLTKCIMSKKDVQLECEMFNEMLEGIDKIDDKYWKDLSFSRHASIRIGPLGIH